MVSANDQPQAFGQPDSAKAADEADPSGMRRAMAEQQEEYLEKAQAQRSAKDYNGAITTLRIAMELFTDDVRFNRMY